LNRVGVTFLESHDVDAVAPRCLGRGVAVGGRGVAVGGRGVAVGGVVTVGAVVAVAVGAVVAVAVGAVVATAVGVGVDG